MRDRVGDGVTCAVFRIDEQRHPHHDRAEIERPGRGGGDHCQGQGGPVDRALRGRLCRVDAKRVRAAAGGDRRRCRPGSSRGSSRSAASARAAVRRGRRDRRLRAVADAGELRGQARAAASTSTPFSSWLPSAAGDVRSRTWVKAPPLGVARAARRSPARTGARRAFSRRDRRRARCQGEAVGRASLSGLPDQGVIAWPVCVRAAGRRAGQRSPSAAVEVDADGAERAPAELRRTCVVSWPVCGLALTLPSRRIERP